MINVQYSYSLIRAIVRNVNVIAIAKGQKEFIIARPTPENVRAFEQWMWLEKRDRTESWLGDRLSECYRFA